MGLFPQSSGDWARTGYLCRRSPLPGSEPPLVPDAPSGREGVDGEVLGLPHVLGLCHLHHVRERPQPPGHPPPETKKKKLANKRRQSEKQLLHCPYETGSRCWGPGPDNNRGKIPSPLTPCLFGRVRGPTRALSPPRVWGPVVRGAGREGGDTP